MKSIKILVLLVVLSLIMSCQPVSEPAIAVAPERPFQPMTAVPPMCTLTMGFDAWEPYQYMTVGNTVSGLDVELVRAIAAEMQCELTMVQGSWVELLGSLKEGEIDFVLGASITQDRQSFAYFSNSYRQEQFQLFVRGDDINLPVTDITGFISAGYKLGIVNQYYYGDEIDKLYGAIDYQPQFVGAIISEMNMARLLDEEIDGLLEDRFVAASILRRKGLEALIKPHDITLGNNDVYVMFSKASVEEQLVAEFNRGLATIKQNGLYQKIVQRYQD
ncbi:amino acid ABC transporter substrate-binding protein [Arsukibacterium sp. MJ3]|uniref:substrate-binding periplasmic protein n=1 Tax=Arsukibacterium sp. MJ3 TaxID=1632859 RepID=UPI0006270300|nr:transporter substrate-binding domain-containing protein [Arsukibacterium sp. MJ3]KKO49963.1 amino acid ABC transporter substrate-binding protein [Arsukibacterium sp. MJ3]